MNNRDSGLYLALITITDHGTNIPVITTFLLIGMEIIWLNLI